MPLKVQGGNGEGLRTVTVNTKKGRDMNVTDMKYGS